MRSSSAGSGGGAAPPAARSGLRPSAPALAFAAACAAALAGGTVQALRHAWITDDAYISFRYARNLLDGLGLVFNAGERVEGYTNFLWTLWCALGMRLGATPEAWARGWGVAFHVATLALLCALTVSRRRLAPGPALPVAALLAALHRDWSVFATGGLETSLFTLLAVAGFALLAVGEPGARRFAAAGLTLALASLARPDGVVFAAVGGVYVAWTARPRRRGVLAYGGAFLAVLLPYLAWKLAAYGDLLPNTFYAKSAGLPWYEQGLAYVGLYFRKYGVTLAGLPIAAWALTRRAERPGPAGPRRAWARTAALAAGFAVAYTAYVARVGGDFMYARLLIPAAPFYLVLLELGLERLAPRRPVVRLAAAAAAALALALPPHPLAGGASVRGVVDEWSYYRTPERADAARLGDELGRLFHGLPIRLAFVGTQAILAYRSRAPVAIEATTGLTDAFVARQPIARRGRVGHEKPAPFSYLVERRAAHFILTAGPELSDSLSAYVPVVPILLGGLPATLLTWDPPVMAELERRGAVVPDFPAHLDRYVAAMPGFSDSTVRADYAKLERFYFRHARDPGREAPFRARLAGR